MFHHLILLATTITSIPLVVKLLGLMKLPVVEYAKMLGSYFISLFRQGRGEYQLGNKYIKGTHFNTMAPNSSKHSRLEKKQARQDRKKQLAGMDKIGRMKFHADEKAAKKKAKLEKKPTGGIGKLKHLGIGLSGTAASVLGAGAYHSYTSGHPYMAGGMGAGSLAATVLASHPFVSSSRKLSAPQGTAATESAPASSVDSDEISRKVADAVQNNINDLHQSVRDLQDSVISSAAKVAPSVSVESEPSSGKKPETEPSPAPEPEPSPIR